MAPGAEEMESPPLISEDTPAENAVADSVIATSSADDADDIAPWAEKGESSTVISDDTPADDAVPALVVTSFSSDSGLPSPHPEDQLVLQNKSNSGYVVLFEMFNCITFTAIILIFPSNRSFCLWTVIDSITQLQCIEEGKKRTARDSNRTLKDLKILSPGPRTENFLNFEGLALLQR